MSTQVKERPILFNAEMVRAVLDGRKTVTRRVVKPQPLPTAPRAFPAYHFELDPDEISGGQAFGFDDGEDQWKCPYGAPGDRLWVRETWACADWIMDGTARKIAYKAKGEQKFVKGLTPEQEEQAWRSFLKFDSDGVADGWTPSIHMPRWASRILLEVVSVKVERVQEITTAQITAEGVDNGKSNPTMGKRHDNMQRMAWETLWDSINAKRGYGWDSNPWVWVVEFKVIATTGGTP